MRLAVKQFAEAMEARLKANDHKGGWDDETALYLFGRLKEELAELECAVESGESILTEAADVANFALMIADVCGHLAD